MGTRRKIDPFLQKVVEEYHESHWQTTREQQDAIRAAQETLKRANLCLVIVEDEGGKELVLTNVDVRELYDNSLFSGCPIDLADLRYLKSEVVTINSNELRRKLEDADDEVRRLGEALKMRQRAADELRSAMAKSPETKAPLHGQHAALRRSRGES